MMKNRPPYLQVVPPDGTAPDFTPLCPSNVDSILWQQFLAIDDILDGKYDQWVKHGGQGVPIPDDRYPPVLPPVVPAPTILQGGVRLAQGKVATDEAGGPPKEL